VRTAFQTWIVITKRRVERRRDLASPKATEATSESNALLGAVQDDLYFALRERDLWMKQCLDAEAKVKAYEDVFATIAPGSPCL